jgi:hypothetical protein
VPVSKPTAVRDAVAIPDSLDEVLSPAWLTAALGQRFPGIEVVAVTPGPVVSRLSTNARFTIECRSAMPDGLSPHLCVKGYFGDLGDLGPLLRRVGQPEAYFYRDLASSSGVRTLRAVYADVDPATGHGVIITEDVVAQGARFLDGRDEFTVDQVADALAQLAKLHAATWTRPGLADAPWLAPRLAGTLRHRGANEIRGNFEGPIGAGVPIEVRDAERLVEAYGTLATIVDDDKAWTVVHGDPHIANVYIDRTGAPGFLDWQLVQRAPWYLDVGYHIASALPVADRRRAEQDLVRHYLEQLTAAGIDAPSWGDAWRGVRRGILHGFLLWGITLKVDPAITAELLTRLGGAAADHDVFKAVT